MIRSRNLKEGLSGADVRYIKDLLFALGYYTDDIKKISNSRFGSDTTKAVIKFQSKNRDKNGKALKADGIVGELTWEAIERVYEAQSATSDKDTPTSSGTNGVLSSYKHIAADKRAAIEKDLAGVSDLRKEICLEILQYAYDKDVPGDVISLYMIGENLYNKDLTINVVTEAKIKAGAKRRPTYYDGGREEWMLQQVKRNPKITASDCSGMEVGYLRKHKLVSSSFDTTANGLTTSSRYSTSIFKRNLEPGDWVGKEGHIGTYVGGGYVVEYYGGAYGCQLTELDNRCGYDFVSGRVRSGGAWTRYRKPTYY